MLPHMQVYGRSGLELARLLLLFGDLLLFVTSLARGRLPTFEAVTTKVQNRAHTGDVALERGLSEANSFKLINFITASVFVRFLFCVQQ